ncbi:hypothetical protein FRB94_012890 [Tulasnella sp. JGI-2019a]|nr:hypothetical protein FRB94_012890 [Tulasnella sp. JGI-2019a]KAG8994271.1 hypothetical protein FRB93_001641 [Tulasnella sp. JGI-2019a]KAG9035552.1 hypothetical protein FRB95_011094 [Tulasnella sp. JGI-2019a]
MPNPDGNVKPRWYMHVHNFSKKRWIDFHVVNIPEGPRHTETWISTIIIRDVKAKDLVQCAGTMHSATGTTKRGAQDAASYLALVALGVAQ